jgi:hypothetical protein
VNLLLELLVAILKLLDGTGELPDCSFEPVDPNQQVRSRDLRTDGRGGHAARERGHEQRDGSDHGRHFSVWGRSVRALSA